MCERHIKSNIRKQNIEHHKLSYTFMIYIWKYQNTKIVIVLQEKPHKLLKESVNLFLAALAILEKRDKKLKTKRQKSFNRQKDKKQKDCLILWCQGSFALLRCFLCFWNNYTSLNIDKFIHGWVNIRHQNAVTLCYTFLTSYI